MAMDKLEQSRREGMSYALRIAEEKGIDGLREDLKRRNALNIPVGLKQSRVDEFTQNVKHNVVDTMLILASVTLRDEFGFGKDRLARFIERFNYKAECLGDDLVEWQDLIEQMQEECGLEFSIRRNDKNVRV